MAWVALDLASELTGWGPESEIGSELKFFRAVQRKPEGGPASATKGNWLWLFLLLGGLAAIVLLQAFWR
jgi:hypothetical protein